MTSPQINKLGSLLNENVVSEKVTRLTAPGENYGSLMLRVDVTLHGNEEIYLVAKVVPPNERTREHFNTEETFRAEIAFYKNVIPTLQDFQRENGASVADFFPNYYGSRLNLKNDESRVDPDGVLLLENLKAAGYSNLERTQGFDFETTRLILRDLAQFHAGFVALRLRKNEIFTKTVRPYLLSSHVDEDFHRKTKERLQGIIDGLPKIASLKSRILQAFDNKLVSIQARDLFATVVHNDFWVNNVMVKFENGKPVNSKMVDFQEYTFASLAKDVVFFLFSSVRSEVLERYYQDLVVYYHEIFVSTMGGLKCDVSKFTVESLQEELALEAHQSQFAHLLFMLWPIFTPKGSANEEWTPDDLLEVEPSELHLDKLVFVVQEFARRKWI